jgi:hypothetical protein
MARTQARKVTPKHTGVGGAVPAHFEGGDFDLNGFFMHPTRRLTVHVPVFQHGFYPKLDHTDLDIERAIVKRQVTIPSMNDLRKAGIHTDSAVYVAEVWVHPRYIKHNNYFRTDFPANIKTLSRRDGITFVFPASDMWAARLKRKQVLAFYRAAFTPLFVGGKHYTSGRMTHFFVAPPEVSAGFRKRLNLEHDEDFNNLLEWDPTTWRLRKKGRGTPGRPPVVKFHSPSGKEVKAAQTRLKKEIAPLVNSKLGINPNSKEGKAIIAALSDPDMSKTLLVKTKNKKSSAQFQAVKRWVKQTMVPSLKEFAADQGIQILIALRDFAFQTTVSVAVNHMLGNLKGDEFESEEETKAFKAAHPYRHSFRRFAGRFDYKPSQHATSTEIGAGTLSYKFRGTAGGKARMMDLLKEHALNIYQEKAKDAGITSIGKEFFHITITPGDRLAISLDKQAIERVRQENPDAVGKFVEKNWERTAEFYVRTMRSEMQGFYEEAKKSGEFE